MRNNSARNDLNLRYQRFCGELWANSTYSAPPRGEIPFAQPAIERSASHAGELPVHHRINDASTRWACHGVVGCCGRAAVAMEGGDQAGDRCHSFVVGTPTAVTIYVVGGDLGEVAGWRSSDLPASRYRPKRRIQRVQISQ